MGSPITYIVGVRPPDEKWKKMKAVWDACKAAGTEIPKDVYEFFDHETPDDKGVLVELSSGKDGPHHECVSSYDDNDCQEGFEIDVSKIPKDITIIRVVNHW